MRLLQQPKNGVDFEQTAEPSAPRAGQVWRERSSAGLIVDDWEWSGSVWLTKEKLNAAVLNNSLVTTETPRNIMMPLQTQRFVNILFLEFIISFIIDSGASPTGADGRPNSTTSYRLIKPALIRSSNSGVVVPGFSISTQNLDTGVFTGRVFHSIATPQIVDISGTNVRGMGLLCAGTDYQGTPGTYSTINALFLYKGVRA